MQALVLFLAGAVVGSFINVLIYRVPRKESVIWPRSHCPHCERTLAARDLIPIASYVLLGGKCRYCGQSIRLRYPMVELLCGASFAAAGVRWQLGLELILYIVFFSFLVALALIDVEHKRLPDKLTLPGAAVGIILNLLWRPGLWWQPLAGALAGFVIVMIIALVSRGGMGGGDAKLLGMIGAFIGVGGVVNSLFIGSIIGALFSLFFMALKRLTRKDFIPFGPFLAAGAWWTVVFGGLF